MRGTMDTGFSTDLKFLIAFCLILVFCTTADASSTLADGNLYIRVKTAECSRTKLVIKLEGVELLPKNILFSVRNEQTKKNEVTNANVELQGDEYIWTGLIPLGDFTALISLPNSKKPLEGGFTNQKLLQQFLDNHYLPVQVRNGDKIVTDATKPREGRQQITIGSLARTTRRLHLLLIDSGDKLGAQYLGSPISAWSPMVEDGSYKLVVIEYEPDESNCKINTKR